jgi:hypothetical protein
MDQIKIADEVWIAVALLHRENPRDEDFSISQIVARLEREAIAGRVRPGVRPHATVHCVAGRAPNPGRYCMLTESAPNRRRLFRSGDPVHPARRGAKHVPHASEIPEKYRDLIDWYESEYEPASSTHPAAADPLLALRGTGADLWASEEPDAYVKRLRSGWE